MFLSHIFQVTYVYKPLSKTKPPERHSQSCKNISEIHENRENTESGWAFNLQGINHQKVPFLEGQYQVGHFRGQ